MIKRRFLLTLPPLILAATTAQAQESTRVYVNTGVNVGYSNNPFSQGANSSSSGYVTVDVAPTIELVQERSTITATVAAQVQQFFARYPTTDSYRGSVSYNGRPAERVTTYLTVDVSSAVLGGFDNLFAFGNGTANSFSNPGVGGSSTGDATSGAAGATAGTIGPIGTGVGSGTGFANDLGLFGTRERRQSVYASGGLSAGLSSRDTVTLSAFGDIARYRNFTPSNYEGFGGTVAYSRRLSDYTQVGAQGSYSRYDYNGLLGVTNVYSIQATGSTRINARWTVSGALGVSFVDSNAIGSVNRTSISGNVQLCERSERSNLCLAASRNAQATGSNGSQYVTTFGLNYDRRLNERSSIGFSALYVTQGGVQAINAGQTDYVSVSPNYSRLLVPRLQLQASLRYRQLFGGTGGIGGIGNQQSDYGGQLGLSYRFGR